MKQTICILLILLGYATQAQDPVGAKRFTNQMMNEKGIVSIAINTDGSKVCIGTANTIKVWDINTRKEIQTLSGHHNLVFSVAFSPDGTKIISGSSDKTVKIWDVSSGKELRTLSGHSYVVESVAFSPDGKKIISGSLDATIKIWDTLTGKELQTLSGHNNGVWSVAFSPDGSKIISGSLDHTIKVWNTSTGKEIQTLSGHDDKVRSVAFSPNGKKIISSSLDKTVIIWDINTGKTIQTFSEYVYEKGSIAFSPDGKKFIGSDFEGIKIWDAYTGKNLQTIFVGSFFPVPVVLSPNGKNIISSSDGITIKIWDTITGKEETTLSLSGHSAHVQAVAFNQDGTKIISGSEDNTIKIWERGVEKEIQTLVGHTDCVNAIAFSPSGRKIASGSNDNTVKIWDINTGKTIRTLEGHTGWVYSVAFSPDEKKIASAGIDKTIKIWDTNTGKIIQTLDRHTDVVYSVEFSSDGEKIVSRSLDKTIKIWDVTTWKEIQTLSGHKSWGNTIALSSDRTRIISGSNDNTIKIWDIATGTEIQTFSGHSNRVLSISSSPDGTKIISSSYDYTVKVWDTNTGKEIKSWNINFPAIHVSFANDGKSINVGTAVYWVNFPIEEEKAIITTPITDIQPKATLSSTRVFITNPNVNRYVSESMKTDEDRLPLEVIISTTLKEEQVRAATKVYVNGSLYTGKLGPVKLVRTPQQDYFFEQNINLQDGNNTIEIKVSDEGQIVAQSSPLHVFYTPPAKANLYLFSFGVQHDDLDYTDEDAQVVHRLFKSQQGILFNQVIDEDPYIGDRTDAGKIAQKLEKLGNRDDIREQDVILIFGSSHGLTRNDDFRILGRDYDPASLRSSSISFKDDIIANLDKIKCKKIILIDACLSGASVGKDLSDANRIIAQTHAGMVTITSSTGIEKSYENKAWNNSAFVKGIREALEEGRADINKDERVTILEFFNYLNKGVPLIIKSVPELKGKEQHPQMKNTDKLDFPIFLIR